MDDSPPRGKRKADPSCYERNKIKLARLRGEAYKNHVGNSIEPKKVGPSCMCRKKCFESIGLENVKFIFDSFYNNFTTKNEQDVFLQSLLEPVVIKRRRPRNPDNVKFEKTHQWNYYILSGDKRINVCLNAFLSTFDVSAKRIGRLRSLRLIGKSPVDLRGKHISHTLPAETKLKVDEHIRKFPLKEAHYSNKPLKFLSADLNVSMMFNLFKKENPALKVSYDFYFRYFKDNFNYRFGQPQVDTCCECEQLKIKINNPELNDVAKRVAQGELEVHIRKSKKFYHSIKEEVEDAKSKKNEHVLAICFDFMQNVPMPKIPVQELFYLRQITVNIFNIHDIKNNKSRIFTYHEGTAKKSPNEVCSFLADYFSSVPQQFTELHLYSDNCFGQNKNASIQRFLLALTDTQRFKKIIHFFPIRGHSFLPCDRDFAMIKRSLKKIDRIYALRKITERILKSSINQKFLVTEIHDSSEIINNYDSTWWSKFYKKSVTSVETCQNPRDRRMQFLISNFFQFIYDSDHPGTITAFPNIRGITKHTFKISKNPSQLVHLPNSKAHPTGRVAINSKKIEDIKKTIKYIPEGERKFYEDIVNWPIISTKEEDER